MNFATDLSAMPSDQRGMVDAINAARAAYAAGANEMAKGASRPQRARDICRALPSKRIVNWVGVVHTLSSNSDGKGVLKIAIANEATIGTWNNSFSDVTDRTLIEPGSPLFQTATTLRVGEKVRFGGTFVGSQTDCVGEASVTLSGSIAEPNFLMRFTELERRY